MILKRTPDLIRRHAPERHVGRVMRWIAIACLGYYAGRASLFIDGPEIARAVSDQQSAIVCLTDENGGRVLRRPGRGGEREGE